MNTFDTTYVIDTNIVLNDYHNIEILSQNSSNLIIVPETVMDEIDSKKSIMDDTIGFQARSFGRLLEKADIIHVNSTDDMVVSRLFVEEKNLTIDVISKNSYDVGEVDRYVLNDRKILEVAKLAQSLYNNVVFVSNDVMCRLRGISLGIKTESFGKNVEVEPILYREINIADIDLTDFPMSVHLELESTVFGLCLFSDDGNRKYYYKSGLNFLQVDEKELVKQNVVPMNAEQKIVSSLMLDPYYDAVVISANAGTGKTAVGISAAMKLLDAKESKFDKIVYIRKTVISSDVDLGFLKGDLEQKMSGYLAPLYSTLEGMAYRKYNKKKLNKEEMEEKVADMIKNYNITPMWEGHLRGATIRNAVIIYDEISNNSVADIRTTISRIGENCKLFAIGSLRQIDAKYINKYTSALTFLMNKVGQDNDGVHLASMELTKTVRSKMAEWADGFKS